MIRAVIAGRTGGRLIVIGLQSGVKGQLSVDKLLTTRAGVIGTALHGRPVSGPHSKGAVASAVVADV